MVFFYFFILAIYMLPALTVTTLMFTNGCWDCTPYEQNLGCSDGCFRIARLHPILFEICALLALFIIIAKISVGIRVLSQMKRNLNFYYKTKRNEIILTIALSSFIVAWKCIYNYFNFLREHDLKFNFLNRRPLTLPSAPTQIIVFLTDGFLPIILIIFNIRTVNFRKYLKNLMKG